MDLEIYITEKPNITGSTTSIIENHADIGGTKRKIWNYLLKNGGFKLCPNPAYIESRTYFVHNNRLMNNLIITKRGLK